MGILQIKKEKKEKLKEGGFGGWVKWLLGTKDLQDQGHYQGQKISVPEIWENFVFQYKKLVCLFLFFINRALLFPEFQSKKKYIFCSTFNWPFHNFRGSFYTSTVMFKKCFRHVHTSLLNSEQIWFSCNFRAGNCGTGSRTRLAQNENSMRSRHLGVNRFRVAVNDGPEKKRIQN